MLSDDNSFSMKSLKQCDSKSSVSCNHDSPLNLCVVNQSNLGNRLLDLEKSINLKTRRNVINYSIKSRPVSIRRGTPIGWLSTNSEHGNEVKVFQSHIVLPAPDGQVSPKRGLSGSKIRKSSAASRSDRQTPRNSFVSDLCQELSLQPPHRLLPHKFRTLISNAVLTEDGSELLSNYKWNSSNQGLRMQRELTKLNSIRSMKRELEMVSCRIDPMYCLRGSRLSLLSRYGVDGEEMARAHDLMPSRERASLDVKKMKLKSDSRAQEHRLETLTPKLGTKGATMVALCSVTCQKTQSNDAFLSTESSGIQPAKLPNNLQLVKGSSNIHTATESSDKKPPTECSDINPARESNNTHPALESSYTHPALESSDTHPMREFSDTQLAREFSDTHPMREFSDTHPAREFSDTHPMREFSDTQLAREFSDTHPDSESSDTQTTRE